MFYLGLLYLILFSISPHESDQANFNKPIIVFPYRPNPWEIEDYGEQRFKPYDDKHKNNESLLFSIENNKSCFGNGQGDYRVANFTDIMEILPFLPCNKDKFNEFLDKYLTKYCNYEQKCRVDDRQNKFVCRYEKDSNGKCIVGKSVPQVLSYISEYMEYQSAKFILFGGKKKSIKDGNPCVKPPYKLPFDQTPTKKELEKLNQAANGYLGISKFCKSERCIYDYPSKTFVCRSSSIQPMADLIGTLIFTLGLLDHQN